MWVWKTVRLKFITPPFRLQCYFVASAHFDSELQNVITLANGVLANVMQAEAWMYQHKEAYLLLPFALPWGPAQINLLENEGHMNRVVQLPQLWPF